MLCVAAIVLSSCGSDEELTLGGVDPDKNVPDPVGTITLSMRDKHNGNTYLDGTIQICNENFTGWNSYFTSVGAVKGLGNVANIPTTGWASEVAVIPGNGYVAYSNNIFYRLYVTNFIASTTGGIIGAEVKYQKPFKGKDEAISLDVQSVIFPAEGGTQTVLFKNQGLIVFDVTSKKFQVEKASTNNFFFLADGIAITAAPNYSASAIEDSITLTTIYGKKTIVKVKQLADPNPSISFVGEEPTLTAAKQNKTIGLYTNFGYSELFASSSATWCKAELMDDSSHRLTQSKKVKFIGNRPVNSIKSTDNGFTFYSILLTLDENASTEAREATITVKSKDGRASSTMRVLQKGISVEVETDTVRFDKNSNYRTLVVTSTTDWEAESSEEWCTCTKNGNQITIRTTETTEDRIAIISFKGMKEKVIVHQSKYAVGDSFNEDGVNGEVRYIGDEGRYISLYLGTISSWSTENVSTGANSRDDGEYNSTIIKNIPNWEIYYPAFKLCDDLNVDGVSGWYLPAINECKLIRPEYFSWSSTESDINNAYYYHRYTTEKSATSTKREKRDVYAVRKF